MNELTTTQNNALDRISDPVAAVEKMGEWFSRSGMFGCEKPEQGMILALAAICERKSPLEIADTYHLIGGQLSMKSRAVLAKYRQHGGKVKWIKSDDKTCEADWTFEGDTTRVSFTLEEAKAQGLVKSGSAWTKTPAEMLRARCITRAVTMLAPEILIGGSAAEDIVEPASNPLAAAIADAPKAELPKDPKPAKKAAKKELPVDPTPAVDELAAEKKAEELEAEQLASTEQIKALMEICAVIEKEADAWLLGKGWISESGNLKSLTAENAAKIIKAPEKFTRAVKNSAK